jgi:hypothetical protein
MGHTRDLAAAPTNVRSSGWCGLNADSRLWAAFGPIAVMSRVEIPQRSRRKPLFDRKRRQFITLLGGAAAVVFVSLEIQCTLIQLSKPPGGKK